jgi:hypothetical protein
VGARAGDHAKVNLDADCARSQRLRTSAVRRAWVGSQADNPAADPRHGSLARAGATRATL